jgi:hypothetical protein
VVVKALLLNSLAKLPHPSLILWWGERELRVKLQPPVVIRIQAISAVNVPNSPDEVESHFEVVPIHIQVLTEMRFHFSVISFHGMGFRQELKLLRVWELESG